MIHDVYSKRRKQALGETPDVYRYDYFPPRLRAQVIHIFRDMFTPISKGAGTPEDIYGRIRDVLLAEYGCFNLCATPKSDAINDVECFLLQEAGVSECLDVIEQFFRAADDICERFSNQLMDKRVLENGIADLNQRFRENGVGYEFREGTIICLASSFLHDSSVGPALLVLREPYLRGADEEFRSAHDHFRHERYKECLNDCLKSFESTMKSICSKRQWGYKPVDTASKLIDICKDKNLFTVPMESHLNGLKMCLEGVATARNKLGAHGQGTTPVKVSQEFAAYVLHLTATNILFLANCERALK